jgi:hypothetical protein
MHLEYLLFDATDEEDGSCSFDALASVTPAHMPGLAGEITQVLGWAHRSFGAAVPAEDGGGWDFDLQAVDEDDVPLAIVYDAASGRLVLPEVRSRVTVALTVSGPRAFADAFRDAFDG